MSWHADSPSLLRELEAVYLQLPGEKPRKFKVLDWRPHKDALLLTLVGITDRTAAEVWRGAQLLARAAELPPLAEDEVYVFELEGMRVELADGQPLGVIESVVTEPLEVWTIRTPEGREVLFPAEPEFVPELDPEGGRVVIDPPPGLLDIYLGEPEVGAEADADADAEADADFQPSSRAD